MKLVPVKELPEKHRGDYKSIVSFIREFINSNAKYARVDFEPYEYSSGYSAKLCINKQVKPYGFPVLATTINGEVYLARTDI